MKQFLMMVLFFCAFIASATDVQVKLVALFESKAMLLVNGKTKTLKPGAHFEGVTLIEVDTQQAVIEVNGQQRSLQLGVGILAIPLADQPPPKPKDTVTLWADDSGFFYANGAIGKRKSRFLVDTGANVVALSSQSADSLGLDYKDAPQSIVVTASGRAPAHDIIIKKLNIEGVTLYNIEASVVVGDYPRVPLLGMSFLGKLDMQRKGDKMELKKRF